MRHHYLFHDVELLNRLGEGHPVTDLIRNCQDAYSSATGIEDIDCVGEWSVCQEDCTDKSYSVTIAQSGSGSVCRASDGSTAVCSPGDGACPSECSGLIPPTNGQMFGCPTV